MLLHFWILNPFVNFCQVLLLPSFWQKIWFLQSFHWSSPFSEFFQHQLLECCFLLPFKNFSRAVRILSVGRYCSCFNNLVYRFMMHIFVQIAYESLTALKLINFSLLNSQWNFLVFLFDYLIQFEIEQVFQVLFFFRASSLKKRSNCGFFYSIFSKIAAFIRADGPILFKIFRLNQLSYFRHFFRELALINCCLDFLAWSIRLKTRESYFLFIAFKR